MRCLRILAVVGAAFLGGVLPAGVSAADVKSIAYYNSPYSLAHLIDWYPNKRAHIVTGEGMRDGEVQDTGNGKLILLQQPYVLYSDVGTDECGNYEEQRRTRQFLVRDLPHGMAQIVEMGEYFVIGGCRNGQTTPFGSPDDEGLSTRRLGMAARPPMTDIVPGLRIAGPGESAWTQQYSWPAQDVVTVHAGSVTFHGTGNVCQAAVNGDGWWVFELGSAQQAYTRLEADEKTGGETWLVAEWRFGQIMRVAAQGFVKPLRGAGFGTRAEAARMWQAGSTVGPKSPRARLPFYMYLYKDGSGEQVSKNLDAGTEVRSPIQWAFEDASLRINWPLGGGDGQTRLWTPLRNEGDKRRWVLETHELILGDDRYPILLPRVNYYLDTGKAVPPAEAPRRTGMVHLGEKPKLPH